MEGRVAADKSFDLLRILEREDQQACGASLLDLIFGGTR